VLLLNDNDAGKPESIHPMTGRCPVAAFTQALYDEARKDGWFVISMKNDWKRYGTLVP